MATRSIIAKQNQDGTFTAVYCHWDGYLGGVGKTLIEHYQAAEKIDHLLSLGDLSSLGSEVDPNPSSPHNFSIPQSNVCVFYGRDRGEEDTEAESLSDSEALKLKFKHAGADYLYVFKDGAWEYADLSDLNLKKLQ